MKINFQIIDFEEVQESKKSPFYTLINEVMLIIISKKYPISTKKISSTLSETL